MQATNEQLNCYNIYENMIEQCSAANIVQNSQRHGPTLLHPIHGQQY